MIVLKTILVPTDFSDASDAALKYGKAFAKAFGASLHVIHVLEDLVGPAWAPEAYAVSLPQLYEDLEKRSIEQLEQLMPREERDEFRVQLAHVSGSPFVEIVRYAREHSIDLVVMGTHGRGPIVHMLLGSVAERVVRKAPCPVLTVRPAQHEFVMP